MDGLHGTKLSNSTILIPKRFLREPCAGVIFLPASLKFLRLASARASPLSISLSRAWAYCSMQGRRVRACMLRRPSPPPPPPWCRANSISPFLRSRGETGMAPSGSLRRVACAGMVPGLPILMLFMTCPARVSCSLSLGRFIAHVGPDVTNSTQLDRSTANTSSTIHRLVGCSAVSCARCSSRTRALYCASRNLLGIPRLMLPRLPSK
jgi:hypothetical protein